MALAIRRLRPEAHRHRSARARDRVGRPACPGEAAVSWHTVCATVQCGYVPLGAFASFTADQQMRGDKDTARLLLTHAHQQASRLQLREARSQCARALARLDRD